MSRVIDAVFQLTDKFSQPMAKVMDSMTSASREGERLRKSIANTGKSITNVGKGMSAAVTVPILGVGTASMAAWKQVDAAYDAIAKGTGATGESLSSLQADFDAVFGAIPVDAGDAGTAIADINTRLGFSGTALREASKDFIKFAEVNNTDLAGAIQNVSRYMGDAGIDAANYGSVLDSLTAASQASGLGVDKLSETLTKYGAPMRALGMSTEESIALFSGWEKAGVNTEIAFSGMKTAISTWSKEGKDASAEFKKVMDEIAACPDIAGATTKAIEVFGKKAGPDLADAIQGGRFEYAEFLDVIEGSQGRVGQTFEDTLDPIDKVKTSMNQLKLAGADLGTTIFTMLNPYIDKAASLVEKATGWFKGLSDEQKELGVKIALMAAAAGPALMAFGKLVTAASGLMKTFSLVRKAGGIAKLGLAMVTSPAGIVIAALIAIIAVVVLVVKNFDKIKKAVQGLAAKCSPQINMLKGAFENVRNAIGKVSGRFSALGTKASAAMSAITSVVGPVVQFFAGVFVTRIQVAFAAVAGFVQGFSTAIEPIINGVLTLFQGVLDFITGVFTGDWELAWDGVVSIFSGIFETITGIAKGVINGVSGAINGVIGAINGAGFTIPDWVPVVGGKGFKINIPTIPMLSRGTDNWVGGIVQVHERGGEIIDLPSGSRVYPHDESVAMARREAVGAKIDIVIPKLADQIVVREDADIEKIGREVARELVRASENRGRWTYSGNMA